MSVRSAMILGRLALVFFLGVSPFVPLLAKLYPGYVVPIVLAGSLIIGSPLGLALGHAVLRGLEDEFAEKYRRSERFYLLAAAASQGGLLLTSLGRGAVVRPRPRPLVGRDADGELAAAEGHDGGKPIRFRFPRLDGSWALQVIAYPVGWVRVCSERRAGGVSPLSGTRENRGLTPPARPEPTLRNRL